MVLLEVRPFKIIHVNIFQYLHSMILQIDKITSIRDTNIDFHVHISKTSKIKANVLSSDSALYETKSFDPRFSCPCKSKGNYYSYSVQIGFFIFLTFYPHSTDVTLIKKKSLNYPAPATPPPPKQILPEGGCNFECCMYIYYIAATRVPYNKFQCQISTNQSTLISIHLSSINLPSIYLSMQLPHSFFRYHATSLHSHTH